MDDGDITNDRLLDGQLSIFQPAKGFRAGTDSVLLGASLANLELKGNQALEFGCGAGGALFPAAFHLKMARFTGLEQDSAVAKLAERGVAANALSERVHVVAGDVEAYSNVHENSFDLVFSNPPYFQQGHISEPGEGKDDAYLESLSLDDWLKAMLFVAKPRAQIVIIHRAAELARILARLDKQAGEICVLPVRPYPGAEASRVLVRARKGLRAGPMRLLAGLVLHESKGGALTERADGILRGRGLEWV